MITQEYLKSILHYDHETGVFTWLVNRGVPKAGDVAGSMDHYGYKIIKINGKNYKQHRLVWLFFYGYLPIDQVDHINGVKSDNRIVNLRQANNSQNHSNRRRRIDNSSGFKCVYYRKISGKYQSYISKNGKRHWLGEFNTAEEAHEAYKKASKDLHKEFSNFG